MSRREIEVFNPQAWDSRLRRESWQVYYVENFWLALALDIRFSLRSKRFCGAKSEETGFSAFCLREKWGESENNKEGRGGEGKEGNACCQAL